MKRKKLMLSLTLALSALTVFGVCLNSNLFSNNLLFEARATEVTGGTIVFSGSNSTKNGTTNTTNCDSRAGGNIICKTFNNDSSQSSGHIGALVEGSTIKFFESDGTTEFTFEDLEKISFTHGGTSFGFTLSGIYDSGEEFNLSYSAKTTNPRTINFASYGNVSHIRVAVTSSIATLLNEITITYNCVSKELSGVEVTNLPTKTTYSAGEKFDTAGMLVKALYSNGVKVATEAYTYSPSGVLKSSDTEVIISYRGFSTSIPITVEEAKPLSGIYAGTYSSIDFDNCVYTYGSETVHFSFVQSGDAITFTYVSGDNTSLGNYRLFDGGSSPVPNSTGLVTSSTTIKVTTYNAFGTSTVRTFTKQ